jgi:PAS domain S-box-containing protein
VIETNPENAILELVIKGKQTRGACLYNQGMLSVFTKLFGLESAEVSELQCVVPLTEVMTMKRDLKTSMPVNAPAKFKGTTFGADSCIYKLKWKNRVTGFIRKTAGRKKALEEALQHLEKNHAQLQQAYESLWKSEANYRSLMENASDIICLINSDGFITFINKKGIELSGYSLEEVTGKHFMSFVDIPYKRESKIRFRKAYVSTSHPFELVIKTKDSRLLVLSVTSSILGEENNTAGLMIIARDITKDREIAARLLSAERFAAKGLVAAEIAHEINNSLANIETALFIVKKIRTDSQYKQDIYNDVYEEIDRMSGIVRGILEVYTADNAVIESVNLNNEISKVINITQRRLTGKVITITSNLTPDIPSIPCYPGHIKQILLNLIKNSEESMASSNKKLISISTAKENGKVCLRIEDTGCGIPQHMHEKVFSHLYTTKKEGSGFGLSICQQIAKKYNGNISIQSEEGRGTKVTVSFPANNYA